jgi:hypothetical protein
VLVARELPLPVSDLPSGSRWQRANRPAELPATAFPGVCDEQPCRQEVYRADEDKEEESGERDDAGKGNPVRL